MSKLLLETAKLEKTSTENGLVSSKFDDIYFNQDAGIDESRYVFVEANQLAQRFQALKQNQTQHFYIAELGFGSGLNFLNTLTCWQAQIQADDNVALHYLSCEKYPLTIEDFKTVTKHWAAYFGQLDVLIHHYPPPIRGIYRIDFPSLNAHLHLIFDDVEAMLDHIATSKLSINTWFLDGFAPSKNPSMWQSKVFQRMAKLSQCDGTLSTFTAASQVQRDLKAAGFSLRKQKGFGRKREMLIGQVENDLPDTEHSSLPPWLSLNSPEPIERHASIVGAGIAGCTLAYELSRRGWRVSLIEASEEVAAGASGNPSALVYPSVSLDLNRASELYLHAFNYAYPFYQALNSRHQDVIQNQGLLFSASNKNRIERLSKLSLPPSILQRYIAREINTTLGKVTPEAILNFPRALTLSPQASCQSLLESGGSAIETYLNTRVETIERHGQRWLLKTNSGDFAASTLILCAGASMHALFRDSNSWGQMVRGQIDTINASEHTQQLKQSLSYGGYLSACWANQHVLGASFQPNDPDTQARDEDYLHNLQQLRESYPKLADELDQFPHESRVSFRFSSHDHLPLLGPIADRSDFLRTFHDIRLGKKLSEYNPPNWHENLYVFSALGSKGFLTAPILARCLAALLNKEPLPLQAHLLASLHPHRFDVKTLFRRD